MHESLAGDREWRLEEWIRLSPWYVNDAQRLINWLGSRQHITSSWDTLTPFLSFIARFQRLSIFINCVKECNSSLNDRFWLAGNYYLNTIGNANIYVELPSHRSCETRPWRCWCRSARHREIIAVLTVTFLSTVHLNVNRYFITLIAYSNVKRKKISELCKSRAEPKEKHLSKVFSLLPLILIRHENMFRLCKNRISGVEVSCFLFHISSIFLFRWKKFPILIYHKLLQFFKWLQRHSPPLRP